MFVSVETIRKIAKTLPIGYYAGREVPVEIDDVSETSYYSPLEDKIWIATKNIQNSMKDIDFEDLDQIEKDVRTLMYHELSHAILTPPQMMKDINGISRFKVIFAEINVIEDERIETLMSTYYMGVDFDSMVSRLNTVGGNTPFEKFFDLVRFGVGDHVFIQRLDDLLYTHRDLTRHSMPAEVRSYLNDIEDFVVDFYDNENQKKNEQPETGDDKQEDGQDSQSDKPSTSEDESGNGDGVGSDSFQRVKFNPQTVGKKIGSYEYNDVFKDEINSDNKKLEDSSLTSDLRLIFNSAAKVRQMNSSAVNTYSGRFDPRSVARNDYRYFIQQNRSGSSKGYSKVHLNLFLDRSRSFSGSVRVTNQILRSLTKIAQENPDFSMTIISCGLGETIEDTRTYLHRAYDGTEISKNIFKTVKQVQASDAVNYNIVLYDGSAYDSYSTEGQDGYIGNFAAFNSQNFLVITDPENEDAMKFCPSARVVITEDYTQQLKSNLVKMLSIITR